MKVKTSLAQNEDWLAFAAAVEPEFARCTFKEQLIAACGGAHDIAWAVFFHHGAASLEWLDAEIPFLGKSRPRDLIERRKGDRVRECLWKTP